MPSLANLLLPLAQAADAAGGDGMAAAAWLRVGATAAIFVVAYLTGRFLSRKLRMADHGWKISLTAFALIAGLVITGLATFRPAGDEAEAAYTMHWPTNLGIDLSGGTILVYEIDPEHQDEDIDMDELIAAIRKRIDPGSTKQINLRPYGQHQIEIIIPKVSRSEIEQIKERVTNLGTLEFRIVANRQDDPDLIRKAQALEIDEKQVVDPVDGKVLGRWVPVDPESDSWQTFHGREEWATRVVNPEKTATSDDLTAEDLEVLVRIDEFDVNGGFLTRVDAGLDRSGRPSVNFNFNAAGARRFGALTKANTPRPGADEENDADYRYLAVILDGKFFSAPRLNGVITDSGEISGNFTRERRDALLAVLQAGKLPAQLSEMPISEWDSDATLGADTVRRGSWAMVFSLGGVLVFMLIYYRFSGIVACFALLLNLLLILAVMISLDAALTLPGLAGLVLTVGMAVDANVLIFERIREETDRGSALRMAIRNGFQRATTTIVDANVTTLITAVVLYAIGTDQIKGFAVVLVLGILMSMFTAIFVSRMVFEIAEKRRWISRLKMRRIVGQTNINFIGMRWAAGIASAVVILVGLVAVGARGRNLLDIDFTGGTSAQVVFDRAQADGDPITVGYVREQTAAWNRRVEAAQTPQALEGILGEQAPQPLLRALAMELVREEYDEEAEQPAEEAETDEDASAGLNMALRVRNKTEELARTPVAQLGPEQFETLRLLAQLPDLAISEIEPVEGETDRKRYYINTSNRSIESVEYVLNRIFRDGDGESLLANNTMTIEGLQTEAQTAAPEPAAVEEEESVAEVSFAEPMTHDALVELVERHVDRGVSVTLRHPKYKEGSTSAFTEWTVRVGASPSVARPALEAAAAEMAETPIFPGTANIGTAVATSVRGQAIAALIASLIGIIIYIWVRFQKVSYGLAAVAALVHDVLITLGFLALSAYLAGVWYIDPFKISMEILAAFLTIIGYSLNDTIVIFDRIREVKGKSPKLSVDMVNTSLNQTLSRTLLTSVTTLIVVLILFFFGGHGLHGFAFALVIGVISGTYSTVFIASPVLLWLSRSGEGAAPAPTPARAAAGAPARAAT